MPVASPGLKALVFLPAPQYSRETLERSRNMSSPAAPGPRAKDPSAVDPKHYTVEYEDDRVRVLRIRYGPGERSTMHSHPQSIAVVLTDANIRMTYGDGTTEDMQVGPG